MLTCTHCGHAPPANGALCASCRDDAVEDALRAMGEDPATVAAYLSSPHAWMRVKGTDRVREAEARVRREALRAVAR